MTRRPTVPPGSLADRIRTAAPARVGATMAEIVAVALARPEDVREEVKRLRRTGHLRKWGNKRGMRYFWQAGGSR